MDIQPIASVLHRNPNESRDEYSKRRRLYNLAIRRYLKGRVVWPSKTAGVYRKSPTTTGQYTDSKGNP